MGMHMKLLTQMAFVAALLLFSAQVMATAQTPDKLTVDGKEYPLTTNPLGPYLNKTKWRPPKNAVIWSSNWRGYVASWEIDQNQLVLTKVKIEIEGKNPKSHDSIKQDIRSELFPNQSRVVANWYTGALIVPDGEMTNYVHMGYGSSYSHYQIFRIKSGQVVEHLSMSEKEFDLYKNSKFDAFKSTPEFKKAYSDTKAEIGTMTNEQILDFLKSFYAEEYLSI
jgi:hypothetical protein